MPTFSFSLTDAEVAAIKATSGLDPELWADRHLKAPAQECVTHCKARDCAAVGIAADLTRFGLTAEEQESLIAARAAKIADAKAAAEAAAKAAAAAEEDLVAVVEDPAEPSAEDAAEPSP